MTARTDAQPQAAPVVPQVAQLPITFRLYNNNGNLNKTIIQVGCGGTGGWLAPMITKVVRPHDQVIFIDPDVVEERNTRRQAFRLEDVGKAKAEVMADRYADAMPDVTVLPVVASFDSDTPATLGEHIAWSYVIILGCVDNRAARKAIVDYLRDYPSQGVYIDCGNETRGGQVLMTIKQWNANVWGPGVPPYYKQDHLYLNANALVEQCPGLIDPSQEDNAPSCGQRMDLQTPAANHMAASLAFNMLSATVDSVPMSNLGAFFSTIGPTRVVPIKRYTFNYDRQEVSTLEA